jgi:hypothetical protein
MKKQRKSAKPQKKKDSRGAVEERWQRTDSVGEEAPGGTVSTPDQNVVDDLGAALGIRRAPDEEFHPSTEILERRDRRRREEDE